MKLTVKERLIISVLYPQQSDILTQVLVKDLQRKLDFTQEELKEINFRVEGHFQRWDKEKAKDLEVVFTEAELKLLKESVDKLDKEKKVTPELLDLCLKIRNE